RARRRDRRRRLQVRADVPHRSRLVLGAPPALAAGREEAEPGLASLGAARRAFAAAAGAPAAHARPASDLGHRAREALPRRDAGGPVRQSLARKYLAGLTPGYRKAAGLRGNVHGWPREQVNAWRAAYLRARAAAGVAGFGEFDFRFENSRAWVMRDVLAELAA